MPFNNKKAVFDPRILGGLKLVGGAAGAVGGVLKSGGSSISNAFGFGAGGAIADTLSKSAMGLKPLFIAGTVEMFAYLTGELYPVFGIFLQMLLIYLIIKKYLPGDNILKLFLWFKTLTVIYIIILGFFPSILHILPELHRWIFILPFFGNYAFPITTMYVIFTGFISNRTGGIIVQIIYFVAFLVLIFWAYGQVQDELGDLFAKAGIDIKATMPAEQKTVLETFVRALIQSTKTGGSTVFQAMRNFPQAVANFIDPKISAAGGESLFGNEKKEQPKLGIVLQPHPSGATTSGENTIVKALITIPNPLEDMSFLTVTKIECLYKQSRTEAEIEGTVLEYSKEELQKGVNVFYNRPLTVSCEFDKEELGSVSTITLAVGYNFESNANLITYVMKDGLLEDLLIRNEDPLDYMAVPSNKRNPSTKYDNGPARFGIGPIELNNPPLGISDDITAYPAFELVIGNKASDFNGFIGKVNNIFITLPEGFSLTGDTCPFKKIPDNPIKYSISEKAMEDKLTDFTNIKTSRFFTCPMEVNTAEALGAASFSQVEFNVDADFTYEAEVELSTKPRS